MKEYEDEQTLPFSLSFVSPKTVRLRIAARSGLYSDEPSLMLDGEPQTDGSSWEVSDAESSNTYEGPFGSVILTKDPVRFEFRDASGTLLTQTWNLSDAKGVVIELTTPFSFVRSASNLHRHLAASFSLAPEEKLFGAGSLSLA